MDNENLSTEEIIEDLMDDDGFLPGDADYVEPEPEETEEEEEESEVEPEGDTEEEEDEDPEGDGVDTDEEEEEEAPDGDPQALSDETLLDLQIGDETYEVNLAELKSGYLRNEEYVTMMESLQEEHDERVAELELKQAELVKELEIASVISTGDLAKYDQINWNQLKAEDPARFNELRLEALDAREKAQRMVQRRNAVAGLDAEAKRLKYEASLKHQMQLAETLIPELKDETERNKIISYAQSVGFTKEDIMGISDAKTLLILNNSRKYAESQVRKKEALATKVSKDLPLAIKPGSPKTKATAERTASKRTANRVRQEQSVEAAAAHFANVINFD